MLKIFVFIFFVLSVVVISFVYVVNKFDGLYI